jgi:hypothetical protein
VGFFSSDESYAISVASPYDPLVIQDLKGLNYPRLQLPPHRFQLPLSKHFGAAQYASAALSPNNRFILTNYDNKLFLIDTTSLTIEEIIALTEKEKRSILAEIPACSII